MREEERGGERRREEERGGERKREEEREEEWGGRETGGVGRE